VAGKLAARGLDGQRREVSWSAEGGTILVPFPNEPAGLTVEAVWQRRRPKEAGAASGGNRGRQSAR